MNVMQHGHTTQTATWTVEHMDEDLFGIKVDPPVIQLYERILFCYDLAEFNDSYIDGCDNYFRKK